MSLGSMLPVDFEKCSCRRVEFRGQEPRSLCELVELERLQLFVIILLTLLAPMLDA